MKLVYRGSIKHKDWRPGGGFGTICPKWTHATEAGGFASVPEDHPWAMTAAAELLTKSIAGAGGRRYAAGRGIAFRAEPTGDGTWHGYPTAWDDVPLDVQDKLIEAEQVTRREIRRQRKVDRRDIRWALKSDEE